MVPYFTEIVHGPEHLALYFKVILYFHFLENVFLKRVSALLSVCNLFLGLSGLS